MSTQGGGGTSERSNRSVATIIGIVIVIALVIAWLARNRNSVEVDWLFFSTTAPVAVVIVVAAVAGWIIGSLTTALIRRRKG
jgi:uncharacterized integral membrane protein